MSARSLVVKAVAAIVHQLLQALRHGPAQGVDVVKLVDVLFTLLDAFVEAAPVLV